MSNHRLKGLNKNASSPGTIANKEHHDPSGGHKGIDGCPIVIKKISNTASTTPEPVDNQSIIRTFNDSGATAYVWIGKEDEIPVTVDSSNGVAVAPGLPDVFFSGYSDDPQKSLMVKTSSDLVQVVIMDN